MSDLHLHRRRSAERITELVTSRLAAGRLDLVLLTGDYMDRPGDEPPAMEFFARLHARVRPKYGFFGVLGNHDSPLLRSLIIRDCPWLNLLDGRAVALGSGGLLIAGLDGDISRQADPQALWQAITRVEATARRGSHVKPDDEPLSTGPEQPRPSSPGGQGPQELSRRRESFILLLAHHPTWLPVAADLDIDLMLSGHTHGGQIRLPGRRALFNSTDLPPHLSSGLIRHQNTLAVVTRGLGETLLPFRFLCPRQLPILTLNHGPLPGQWTSQIVNLDPW